MVERRLPPKVLNIALFVALAGAVTLYRLLPVQDYSGGVELGAGAVTDLVVPDGFLNFAIWPAPDLLLCLTLAWVVRRPDLLPAPVIAAYFLCEDLLLLRPPGAWAFVVLMGTEFLRRRTPLLRGAGFWLEYALVTGLMGAMFVAYRALLAIVMVPQAPLDLSFVQLVGTVVVYPVIVALVHFVLNLRKPATGELDGMGQKL
jgi:rod shape-determining protein MreD